MAGRLFWVAVQVSLARALRTARMPVAMRLPGATSRRGAFGAVSSCAGALVLRPGPGVAAPFYCDEAVTALTRADADVYIVGTAHVSDLSAKLVAATIDALSLIHI